MASSLRTNLSVSLVQFLLHCTLAIQAKGVSTFDGLTLSSNHEHVRGNAVARSDRHFHKFVTRPDIDAPVWNIEYTNKDALAEGYWFVSPYQGLHQRSPGDAWVGPHIYDNKGDLIWSGTPQFQHWNTYDFSVDDFGDQRYLNLLALHQQRGYILDNAYQVRKTVPLVHDGEDESEGLDKPLFDRDARGYIGLDESTNKQYNGSVNEMCTKGWDNLHFNAIDKFPDGDYLLSARHTDALYKVSHNDSSIVWRLGGTKSDFEFTGATAHFSRQHHGRVLAQNATHTTISLLDNAKGGGVEDKATNDYSRGLILLLDTIQMKASVAAEYPHPRRQLTNARGSFQLLSNGNAFLCWAYSSLISEHTPDGEVAMEASFMTDAHTYRAFKSPWVGYPAQPPVIHSEAFWTGEGMMSANTVIHVSWNGATEVRKWRVNVNNDEGAASFEQLLTASRDGFETRIELNQFAMDLFVEALDEKGQVIGKSKVITTQFPERLMVFTPAEVETQIID